MKAFLAIFKHEIGFYFSSPIAYVVLVIFALLGGYFNAISFLLQYSEYSDQYPMAVMNWEQTPSMMRGANPKPQVPNYMEMIVPPLYMSLSIVVLFLVPLLTMRSIAEEKKEGTIELLYTYPVSDLQVVLAKYFAALFVYFVAVAVTAFYLLLPDLFKGQIGSIIEWKAAFSALLGFFMFGAACIALGFMFSSMTENQVIAAALTFALLLMLWIIGWASQGDAVPEYMKSIADTISLTNRSQDSYKGLLHLSDIVFFACVTVGGLFITMRALESHRWRA